MGPLAPSSSPQVNQTTFELLGECEFTSERRRMSVVVRDTSGEVLVFTKGADVALWKRLGPSHSPALLADTQRSLDLFALQGLRTLLVAYRKVSPSDWKTWQHQEQAALALPADQRGAALAAHWEQREADLTLLGVVAIEDRLQEGVPATIHAM